MRAVLDIVLLVLQLAIWIVIAQAILSWLITFNVLNTRNQFVSTIWRTLQQVIDPFTRPIQRVLPSTGGLDFSPLVLILGIIFLQRIIIYYVYPGVI